ncbi:hypothetical protein EVAR_11930_1 [Eumeta japonica]|uniref:Uncharacterized protein n=1 Tax=Eumeta variegata TaxID=151549 RepID=A0A4C1U4R1_EUMVA|nr:hypothetical protein EVAR_11930_1 [Eumeta japonica]
MSRVTQSQIAAQQVEVAVITGTAVTLTASSFPATHLSILLMEISIQGCRQNEQAMKQVRRQMEYLLHLSTDLFHRQLEERARELALDRPIDRNNRSVDWMSRQAREQTQKHTRQHYEAPRRGEDNPQKNVGRVEVEPTFYFRSHYQYNGIGLTAIT